MTSPGVWNLWGFSADQPRLAALGGHSIFAPDFSYSVWATSARFAEVKPIAVQRPRGDPEEEVATKTRFFQME